LTGKDIEKLLPCYPVMKNSIGTSNKHCALIFTKLTWSM